MKPFERIRCKDFPCLDVNKSGYIIPAVDIQSERVKAIIISDSPPEKRGDCFYSAGEPFYLKTTLQAFNDAGISVSSIHIFLTSDFTSRLQLNVQRLNI
jgi:uracil-DNA glycosylase